MQQTELTFPTLEFNGYPYKSQSLALAHIFNQDQLYEMEFIVNRSVYFAHLFTEVCKGSKETFSEQLKLQHPVFLQAKREFAHRINKLYSHPNLAADLDSGTIDFKIV